MHVLSVSYKVVSDRSRRAWPKSLVAEHWLGEPLMISCRKHFFSSPFRILRCSYMQTMILPSGTSTEPSLAFLFLFFCFCFRVLFVCVSDLERKIHMYFAVVLPAIFNTLWIAFTVLIVIHENQPQAVRAAPWPWTHVLPLLMTSFFFVTSSFFIYGFSYLRRIWYV